MQRLTACVRGGMQVMWAVSRPCLLECDSDAESWMGHRDSLRGWEGCVSDPARGLCLRLRMQATVDEAGGAETPEGEVNVLRSVRLEVSSKAIAEWFGQVPIAMAKKAEAGRDLGAFGARF